MRTHWTRRFLSSLGLAALAALTVAAGAGPAGAAGTFRVAVGWTSTRWILPKRPRPLSRTWWTTWRRRSRCSVPTARSVPGSRRAGRSRPDGTVYTFKLRKGVVFHDGTPFDAKAVKWNFDRLKDTQVRVPIRAPFPIKETEAVDASTVKVTLTRPSAPFISALSWTTRPWCRRPRWTSKATSTRTSSTPSARGPTSSRSGRRARASRSPLNDKYWGKKPTYDTVVFRIVPEAATRESLILAGQVDLIVLPPIADVPALQRNPARQGPAGAERSHDLHLAEHDQGVTWATCGSARP